MSFQAFQDVRYPAFAPRIPHDSEASIYALNSRLVTPSEASIYGLALAFAMSSGVKHPSML
jgi:hypothetical protein